MNFSSFKYHGSNWPKYPGVVVYDVMNSSHISQMQDTAPVSYINGSGSIPLPVNHFCTSCLFLHDHSNDRTLNFSSTDEARKQIIDTLKDGNYFSYICLFIRKNTC